MKNKWKWILIIFLLKFLSVNLNNFPKKSGYIYLAFFMYIFFIFNYYFFE